MPSLIAKQTDRMIAVIARQFEKLVHNLALAAVIRTPVPLPDCN
jgi:hypothetical protein